MTPFVLLVPCQHRLQQISTLACQASGTLGYWVHEFICHQLVTVMYSIGQIQEDFKAYPVDLVL